MHEASIFCPGVVLFIGTVDAVSDNYYPRLRVSKSQVCIAFIPFRAVCRKGLSKNSPVIPWVQ